MMAKPLTIAIEYGFPTSSVEEYAVAAGDVKPGNGAYYVAAEDENHTFVLEGTYYATKGEAESVAAEYIEAGDAVIGTILHPVDFAA